MVYSQVTHAHAAPIRHVPLPPRRPGPVLFLDFDGVLHRPSLRTSAGLPALDPTIPGHRLFERLPLLDPVVDAFPDLQMVLSTTWVPSISVWQSTTPIAAFDGSHPWACTLLPMLGRLGQQVVGSTFEIEHASRWDGMTRYEQIEAFAARHHVDEWFALDDDTREWPLSRWYNIVCVNPRTALTVCDVDVLWCRLNKLRGYSRRWQTQHPRLAVGAPA